MKNLACITLVFLLSGCSVISAYKTRSFDNIEQDKINYIKTLAEDSKQYCGNNLKMINVTELLRFKALEFKNYSNSLPHNEETAKLSVLLFNLIEPLYRSYKSDSSPSETFCKLKLANIEESAEKIQLVTSKRPK